jgi:hypothetical protein
MALQYTKAHVGITTNEWADPEAKAALGAAQSARVPEMRQHCSAILIHPGTRSAFTAGNVREPWPGQLRGSPTVSSTGFEATLGVRFERARET